MSPNPKGGNRRKKRLADMTIRPGHTGWAPYRATPVGEWAHADMLGGITRISQGLWWDGGLLTDMVLLQLVDTRRGTGDEPEWEEIVRVDCCHHEVHVHLLYLGDPDNVYKVIKGIETPEDLQVGAEAAEELVYDEWQEHQGRWESGPGRR